MARHIKAETKKVKEVLYKIDGFRTRTNKDAHKILWYVLFDQLVRSLLSTE